MKNVKLFVKNKCKCKNYMDNSFHLIISFVLLNFFFFGYLIFWFQSGPKLSAILSCLKHTYIKLSH